MNPSTGNQWSDEAIAIMEATSDIGLSGYEILQHVEDILGRNVAVATLFRHIRHLMDAGLIERAVLRPPTGVLYVSTPPPATVVYLLTDAGRAALENLEAGVNQEPFWLEIVAQDADAFGEAMDEAFRRLHLGVTRCNLSGGKRWRARFGRGEQGIWGKLRWRWYSRGWRAHLRLSGYSSLEEVAESIDILRKGGAA